MAETIDTDVAIVGAGPAGLFAVFECGMLKMRAVLIDALDAVGGQCTALYPEKPIYDIPAHPAIEAGDLVTSLEAQIAPFAAPRLLGRRVTGLAGTAGNFTLTTDQGDRITARAVILAAGGFSRQARGDRRGRRFGGGLGAGAEGHRRLHRRHPSPAEVPGSTGDGGAAG
jgi:thioredoxin reductase (NADPH)